MEPSAYEIVGRKVESEDQGCIKDKSIEIMLKGDRLAPALIKINNLLVYYSDRMNTKKRSFHFNLDRLKNLR